MGKVIAIMLVMLLPFSFVWAKGSGEKEEEGAHEESEMKLDKGGRSIPFSYSRMIIEVNATDGDSGVQVDLDGEGWDSLNVISPDGEIILNIEGDSSVGKQGLTELFFESAEPSFDDLPLDKFLDRFPEGEYQFIGKSMKGETMVGTATFTHDIPSGPRLLYPVEDDVIDPNKPVVLKWEPVTKQFTNSSRVDIVRYQVLVLQEDYDPILEFSIFLPASATSVTVPPEFFEPGKEYSYEVLAIEKSGNQTLSETSFITK